MKNSPKSKKSRNTKVSINLPDQRIWKELERPEIDTFLDCKKESGCKKIKKIGRLLDKAFELLLEKLIRQN